VPYPGFWDILSWMLDFNIKITENFEKKLILPHFWHSFSTNSLEMMLDLCNVKENGPEKRKSATFGPLIWTKNRVSDVYLKYLKISDFQGFVAIPKVKKWLQIYWNLLILQNWVSKQVYFKKMSKIGILDKVGFCSMDTL